jgi:molybdopterin/thiamine biosynthesis adenylyltransferase/rhodanese-related sulfurtransferase
MSRFSRQIILDGFGEKGQASVEQAAVLVVGAGGLGCPAIQYLAAAGLGTILFMDGDFVEESNLNRQVLYGQSDIGNKKVTSVIEQMTYKYPTQHFVAIDEFLSDENAEKWISKADIIIDASDNLPTRQLIDKYTRILRKPMVLGAIYKHQGFVSILNSPKLVQAACYSDLFNFGIKAGDIPNCNETGVLGVLPGIIGTIQAAETIKYLSGYGSTLENKLLLYDLLNHENFQFNVQPQIKSEIKPTPLKNQFQEITWEVALQFSPDTTTWVDIRELFEEPKIRLPDLHQIPMRLLENHINEINQKPHLILVCQHGIRSLHAAEFLSIHLPQTIVYSVSGGVALLNDNLL